MIKLKYLVQSKYMPKAKTKKHKNDKIIIVCLLIQQQKYHSTKTLESAMDPQQIR